jgi:ribosomal protein S1
MKKLIEFQLLLKLLTEDPYENIEKKYKVGEIYEGVVQKLWTMVVL